MTASIRYRNPDGSVAVLPSQRAELSDHAHKWPYGEDMIVRFTPEELATDGISPGDWFISSGPGVQFGKSTSKHGRLVFQVGNVDVMTLGPGRTIHIADDVKLTGLADAFVALMLERLS